MKNEMNSYFIIAIYQPQSTTNVALGCLNKFDRIFRMANMQIQV